MVLRWIYKVLTQKWRILNFKTASTSTNQIKPFPITISRHFMQFTTRKYFQRPGIQAKIQLIFKTVENKRIMSRQSVLVQSTFQIWAKQGEKTESYMRINIKFIYFYNLYKCLHSSTDHHLSEECKQARLIVLVSSH